MTTPVRRHLARLVTGLSAPLRDAVASLVERPGKQLRSSLLTACAGFGSADPDRVARLGAVVELVHLASLVHDDVIDRATVRRGRPAAHVVVGAELATLAGLACLAAAGTESAELGAEVSLAVSRTIAELTLGELLDVERGFDTDLPLADYQELVRRKTGTLFQLSCLLGAGEARLDEDARRALARFGLEFGTAFQVMDDCLDLAAADQDKPRGTDHLLGLFGAPTLYALRADSSGELGRLLLAPTLTEEDLPAIRSLVAARGGLDAAADLATSHYRAALAALDEMPEHPARHELRAIAESSWQGQS
nr:polyprenyl synthetase family protein [Kibdelosporangium sp. MJ126-NF4]CEL14855.1 Octaprenyl diphosphate synthase / Dimethylallyltransferase / Geranyltranstransferase / Geranylgeranyl diphosphate synthase [Kibdelosporangium sp. MJ126-NF4]CTQ96514.1 Octaprenyl diphosphate synthase (EC 2.5.1.90) / Dimethylallyltransferase (EC 2.5.1.1) / Geranyltranstransferase (EC 2.5.1.10) / Geranylgeranyl diphosphate synthase (EC 2.5.1.29) [Kibdelosporangium sp. MJ126-NF4]